MSDVFISYKREDEAHVAVLRRALKDANLDVWWDKEIPVGDEWRQRIRAELESAKCVLVVWSRASTGPAGDFVRDEAHRAKQRGTLLQVRIDDVDLPLGFGEHQALDLIASTGGNAYPTFQDVVDTVRARIGGRPIPPAAAVARRSPIGQGSPDPSSKRNAFHGAPLRFLDHLRPDPIAIEAAWQSFNANGRDFRIEWHTEQIQLLTSARRMLDLAVDPGSRTSAFRGRSPDEIARFVGSCSSALREAERILDHASERIAPLLEGMLKHWGRFGGRSELALHNYMRLVAYRLQFETACCLMGISDTSRPTNGILRHLLCTLRMAAPQREDGWKALVVAGEYAGMQTLFDIENKEPLWRARVVTLGDQHFGDFIWAPRSILLSAYAQASTEKMVTNGLFPRYLIPQVEFISIGLPVKYTYNEMLAISKIKNEDNVEINPLSW